MRLASPLLLGHRFEVVVSERELRIGGELRKYKEVRLADSLTASKHARKVTGLEHVRLLPPGAMGTTDVKPGRYTARIDENGVVVEEFFG